MLNIFLPLCQSIGMKKSVFTVRPTVLAAKIYDCRNFRGILLNSTIFVPVKDSESFSTTAIVVNKWQDKTLNNSNNKLFNSCSQKCI